MFEILTEHQIHLFGGIIVLGGLFLGILCLIIYLDKRGVKTYTHNRPKTTNRFERRMGKKLSKAKRKSRKNLFKEMGLSI